MIFSRSIALLARIIGFVDVSNSETRMGLQPHKRPDLIIRHESHCLILAEGVDLSGYPPKVICSQLRLSNIATVANDS